MTTASSENFDQIYKQLTSELVATHGELMTGRALYQSLGYQDSGAFRQARHRKKLAVRTFNVPNRKGCFALTREIAQWMVEAHQTAEEPKGRGS